MPGEAGRAGSPLLTFGIPLVVAIAVVVGALALFARSLPSPATQRTVPVCGAAVHSRLGECPELTTTILANLSPSPAASPTPRSAQPASDAVTSTITPTVGADEADAEVTETSDVTDTAEGGTETTATASS